MEINLSRKKLSLISLSDQCKAIIYGSLLGDGSLQLQKNYANARFYIRHSQVQEEYFLWKVNALQEIASANADADDPFGRPVQMVPGWDLSHKNPSIQISERSGYGRNKSLLFQSRALKQLTEIHEITHKKNRLAIQRRWLNHLTPLSLAVWWLDDGSLISNSRKGVLCTDGFGEESVLLLARYLKVAWDVDARVGPIVRHRKDRNYTKQEYYRLWFGTEELKKFLRIILPCIPACMVKKVLLLYKDTEFQQRWISEILERNSNISENDIVRFLK
jgi:LAGLIDADG DNA endonuclease family